MKRMAIVLILVLILTALPTAAQEDTGLQCSNADTQAALDKALALLGDAQAGDAAAQYAAIVEARTALAEVDSLCLGLDFEGTAGTVHGPLYVPEGIYRVKVATTKFFIMNGAVLEGECGDSYNGEFGLFNEMSGGDFEAEKVFKSEGCTVLFETSNIFGPYQVTFEKLK